MKTAIILHGMPSKKGYYNPTRNAQSNEHWLPWLQHELLIRDILAQTPELPKPYEPNYADWLDVFRRFSPDRGTILVGHSCGGGFLVRWLSENDVKVGKVVLVAPWMDPENETKGFFDFTVDPNIVDKTAGLTVFYSDDDFEGVLITVDKLKKETKNVKFVEFHGYEHFTYNDMKTREFPELLTEVINE